jgi:Protein of unknown function (DUF3604)
MSIMRRTLELSTIVLIGMSVVAMVRPAFAQPNPERNAYFGEEHIHTSWAVDAWVMGNRLTGPGEALKYAQGETIKHPTGFDIKIDTPLDFMGVYIQPSLTLALCEAHKLETDIKQELEKM